MLSKFCLQKAFFPSLGRPALINWWAKNNKTSSRRPPAEILGEVDKFATSWWTWWSALNPEWRERDVATGRIIVGGGADDGDWTGFDRPGQCGLFSVLYSLFWWYSSVATEDQHTLWQSALEDVSWVVNELLNENKYVISFSQGVANLLCA